MFARKTKEEKRKDLIFLISVSLVRCECGQELDMWPQIATHSPGTISQEEVVHRVQVLEPCLRRGLTRNYDTQMKIGDAYSKS